MMKSKQSWFRKLVLGAGLVSIISAGPCVTTSDSHRKDPYKNYYNEYGSQGVPRYRETPDFVLPQYRS